MAATTADRGGPFGRDERSARNWLRAAAPGIAIRCRLAESSPVGGGAAVRLAAAARPRRLRLLALIALLVVAGLACFGNGIVILAKAQLAQVLLHAAWARSQASGVEVRPWPWADTHPVARLIATAQGADVLVLSGASGRTLAFGPGHLDGSAKPGETGNSVIVAHRDTHFRFLQHIAAGDTLVLEGRDGLRQDYMVRGAYVADHRALAIARDTPRPTLTLITCYPFDAINPGGPLRYVVVAEEASRSAKRSTVARASQGARRV